MVRLRSHRRRAVGLSLLALVAVIALSACTQAPVTVQGGRVQALYQTFLIAAGVVFVVVAGLIGWNIVRYRGTPDRPAPPQTRGQLALEIAWWALPTLLVIGLFVYSAIVMNANDSLAGTPDLRVKVTGSQWQWTFEYLDTGARVTGTSGAPPELVLPVHQSIDFEIVATDVIHSFFIPAFLVKRDAIPGVDNHLRLTIDDEGTYSGQCAEFCGLYHDRMLFTVHAVSRDAFQSWLASQTASAP